MLTWKPCLPNLCSLADRISILTADCEVKRIEIEHQRSNQLIHRTSWTYDIRNTSFERWKALLNICRINFKKFDLITTEMWGIKSLGHSRYGCFKVILRINYVAWNTKYNYLCVFYFLKQYLVLMKRQKRNFYSLCFTISVTLDFGPQT